MGMDVAQMKYKHVPFKELWREFAHPMLMAWTAIWFDIMFVRIVLSMPNEPIAYVLIAMAGFQTSAALHSYVCQKKHTRAAAEKWVREALEDQMPKLLAMAEAQDILDKGF
jgi:hypothetical protein